MSVGDSIMAGLIIIAIIVVSIIFVLFPLRSLMVLGTIFAVLCLAYTIGLLLWG